MSSSCPPRARRRGPAVHSAEDALSTLAIATDAGRDTCVVVGSLDGRHRPLCLVVVDGARAADVPAAVDLVTRAAASPHAEVAAVFVACSGDAAAEPGPAECAAFAALGEQVADAGIVLLDWFMLADGVATSVAHRAGRTPAW